ncbi:MAG: ABC transporter ATP-binding protein [Geminicoccaceae bacterium]
MIETTTSPVGEVVLRIEAVSKRFGALLANDAIDLELRAGEILALLGENGAGKTTLMNILFGHYVADSGRIFVRGEETALAELKRGSPQAALAAGIGMVHQHFTLSDSLTGFDNITLGTEPLWRLRSHRKRARRRIQEAMADAGLEVGLDQPVHKLSVGERQRIEILKALYRRARILIFDEPTAVLTPQQTETLFSNLRRLAAAGLAIVLISHKLKEVRAVSDRIAVLRAGRKVAETSTGEADERRLAEVMVGRTVTQPQRAARPFGGVVLQADRIDAGDEALSTPLRGVSFTLRAGQILGIAGVSGNGQAALSALIAGEIEPREGSLTLDGMPLQRCGPAGHVAAGIGRIPEDRQAEGVIADMSVADNAALERVRTRRHQRFGWLDRSSVSRLATRLIEDYDVRCPGPDAPIRLLSGGNMQKLILARTLDAGPRVILAHQPTRGLDVGAVAFIHEQLLAASDKGAGILLISEDLDELFALSDDVAVMFRGALSEPVARERADRVRLGLMMAGRSGFETSDAAA